MTERTPGPDDSAAIAALVNEYVDAFGGVHVGADDIRPWFGAPYLAAEDYRVVEEGGRLVAYGDLTVREGSDVAWLDARVPPGGPFDVILAWAERRARERGAARLRANLAAAADPAPLASRGFVTIRHFFQMAVELAAPGADPRWPEGVEPRPARPGEEERVHAAVEEAFADHWEFEPRPFDPWLAEWRTHGIDHSLWLLALDGGEIAGAALSSVQGPPEERTGWVASLSVRRPWRRRGLGEALLRAAFAEFRARGLRRAGLDVDAENTTGAVSLYERVGMSVVQRTDLWERALG